MGNKKPPLALLQGTRDVLILGALAGAAACLALVAFVAVGLPVARALRIDPAEVLRAGE